MILKKEKLSSLIMLRDVGGVCYKKDFYFLLGSNYSESKNYKYLLDNELISEYQITSENRKKSVEDTATIVALTADQARRSQLASLTGYAPFKLMISNCFNQPLNSVDESSSTHHKKRSENNSRKEMVPYEG